MAGKNRDRFESLVWRLNDIERRLAALDTPAVTGLDETSIERLLMLRTDPLTATAPADPLGSRFEEQMGTAAREWVNGKPTPSNSTPFWECEMCMGPTLFWHWKDQEGTVQAIDKTDKWHAQNHQPPPPASD